MSLTQKESLRHQDTMALGEHEGGGNSTGVEGQELEDPGGY